MMPSSPWWLRSATSPPDRADGVAGDGPSDGRLAHGPLHSLRGAGRLAVVRSSVVAHSLMLIVVGLVHHDNVMVPVLAVIGGALILAYDFTSARRRERDLEGPDA